MSNVAGPSSGQGSGHGSGAATRAAIAEAAGAMFAEHGYGGTSVRAIAGAVGVDPALVVRYFGSKERLFLETIELPGFITKALDGPLETLGERLVEAVFAGDLPARLSTISALLRASDSDPVREKMRQIGELTFTTPLKERLGGPGAELRARLIGAQVNGLLTALAMGDENIVRADRATVIAEYGRAVQALVDR